MTKDIESKRHDKQLQENRQFDREIAVHQEKISSLETALNDFEQRMRVVEKFHYTYATITFIVGAISMTIIQILIRKYIV